MRTGRMCGAAFAADAALYLVMLSLPFRALDMGATAWQLGLVPALYAVPYSATALIAGRRVSFHRRRTVLRVSAGLGLVAVMALGSASSLTVLLAGIPALGVCLGAFWPTLHTAVSDAAAPQLGRTLGQYNMSWSAGKGVGFLAGGLLLDGFGPPGVTLVAAGLLAVAAMLPPRMGLADSVRADLEPPHRLGDRFRRAAWVVNGTTFALAATLNHHFPRLAPDLGVDEREFGAFLGLVFLSQTATFWGLRHWQGWRYRPWSLVTLPALLFAVALLAPQSRWIALLCFAPLIGGAMGLAYQSSLYYSVRTVQSRARDSGVHEAVLQTTATSIPLLGGILVGALAWNAAPFHLAAIACVVAALVTGAWLWRREDDVP